MPIPCGDHSCYHTELNVREITLSSKLAMAHDGVNQSDRAIPCDYYTFIPELIVLVHTEQPEMKPSVNDRFHEFHTLGTLICSTTVWLWLFPHLSYRISLLVLTNQCPSVTGLTHWDRDEMDSISQTTFSNVFSSMKIFEFWLAFHRSLFLRVQLTIFRHWFR